MIVVYTTIVGGSDSLKPAPVGADRCVCFVDDVSAYPDHMGWELVKMPFRLMPYSQWIGSDGAFTIEEQILRARANGDPRREAWHLRCIAHKLFPKADRTVWIDASFTLTDLPLLLTHAGDAPIAALRHHERGTCYKEAKRLAQIGQSSYADIERQVAVYRAAGFAPKHLSISCVIVRDNSATVQAFNETWDEQIRTYPGDNTQISLDYSAWTHGLTIKALQGTRHDNPYAVHNHADHKRRRRPYDTEAA